MEKCQKHGVSIEIDEAAFLNGIVILPDEIHSQEEKRYRALGKTKNGRTVFVVFTLRKHENETLIRPISARYMHQKEVASYEKEDSNI